MTESDLHAMAVDVRSGSLDSDARVVARWALELVAECAGLRIAAAERLAAANEVAIMLEHAQNAHMATLQQTIKNLNEQRDGTEKLGRIHADTVALAELAIHERDVAVAELVKLRPLADAIRAYVTHYYFPRLKAAWDLFNAPKE